MKLNFKREFIITLLMIMSAATFGQDSSDVSLISEYYDMWMGIGSPVVLNDYAYVARNGGFRILDVQDEENPELVGLSRSPDLRSILLCFTGFDSLLFAGIYCKSTLQNEELIYDGGWLQIFDVSDPEEPAFLSEIEINGLSPSHILRRDDTLFIVGDRRVLHHGWESWWYPAIYILDISDPTSPRIVTDFIFIPGAGVPLSVEIHGDLIYAVISHQIQPPAMWIADLTQQEVAILVQLDDWETISAATVTDDYAVVIGEDPDLAVVDISDPENCDIIGTYQFDGGFVEGSIVQLQGTIAYVFSQRGVMSFDLSEPENPRLIDELETPLEVISGEWIYRVYPPFWIGDDHACVMTESSELLFLDLTDSDDMRILGCFTPEVGIFRKVARDGDRLLIIGRSGGSPILDVSDPQNLNEIGSAQIDYYRTLIYENDRIFSTYPNRGLMIYNAVNPDSVWFEGGFRVPNYSLLDFELRGDLVYTCGWNSFKIADISDPDSAYQIIEYDIYATSMAMKDDLVYLGGGRMNNVDYENIHILDIANPDEIEEIGLIEMGRAKQVEVKGDMLFVCDIENQLHFFDISQPETPERLSVWSNGSTIAQYYVEEPTVFILTAVNGMRVVDYSQPDRPIETGFYTSEDPIQDINVNGNIVYAVDGRTLKVLDVSRALGTSNKSAFKPFEFRLYPAYPNPFNSSTTIRYSLPMPSHVSLEVYNALGQRMTTLFNGNQTAGFHTCTLAENDLPSGLYFVRLNASAEVTTQKIMLIK
ncbi:T9SS type A sorting domain-containing protein [bacterium]|nr:T9SS type A sorting domain-containing protein [bacterium]